MKQLFKDLFDYQYHCNQKLFHSISHYPEATSERCLQLFHHIINAHHIWNHRITKEKSLYSVWEIHEYGSLKDIDLKNKAKSMEIIEAFDLDSNCSYINSKGEDFTNRVRDILFHIINHSTHHRAQIGIDMKNKQIAPLPMDYIFYKR